MFGNDRISPELLLLAGSSLAGGQTVGQQLGGIGTNVAPLLARQAEQRQQMEQQNKTLQYLKQTNPQLAAQVEAGMPVSEAWQQLVQAQQPKRSEFKVLPDGTYGAWDGQKFNTLGTAQKPADLPAIADEYNWMKTQGFKGTPQEYQAWKSSLSKTGMMVENDGNGNFRMVQGDPSTFPTKPLTEAQSKDQNFLQRAQNAETNLVPVESELTSWAQKRATGLPMDMGNYLTSPEYQKAEQAGKEVLAIILRKDTGAAVTPQEFKDYGAIYLPQPGNDKEVIAQKRAARQVVIKAIADGLPDHIIKKMISEGVNVKTPGQADTGVVPYTDFFK
jgi:hypothetical protein